MLTSRHVLAIKEPTATDDYYADADDDAKPGTGSVT